MKVNKLLLIILLFITTTSIAQEIVLQPDSLLKRKAIKVEFFSPLTGNLTLGYENYISDLTSIEAKVGIIGIGKQQDYNANGVFVKIGPKFKLAPAYASRGTFGTHLLRGTYIRPEIAISIFNHQETDRFSSAEFEKKNLSSFALLINYGKQFVLGKSMTLDYHIGVGYGFSNDANHGYYFGYAAGDSDFPVAFSTGFTLGILLN